MTSRAAAKRLGVEGPMPEPCPLWVVALLERTIDRVCEETGHSREALTFTETKTAELVDARERIAREVYEVYPRTNVLARAWGVKPEAIRRWTGRGRNITSRSREVA